MVVAGAFCCTSSTTYCVHGEGRGGEGRGGEGRGGEGRGGEGRGGERSKVSVKENYPRV